MAKRSYVYEDSANRVVRTVGHCTECGAANVEVHEYTMLDRDGDVIDTYSMCVDCDDDDEI